MGLFQQFPYTNFHEMNLDQLIKIMREMQDEWSATKTEWASYKDFIDNYFENLDVSDEVLAALRVLAADGTLNNIMDPVIAQNVTEWLTEHITTPETVVIDDSLTVRGAVADARAAGKIRSEVSGLYKELTFDIYGGYVDQQTGAFIEYDNWHRSGYIEVDPTTDLYIQAAHYGNFNCIYDTDHNKISQFNLAVGLNKILLPENAKYIAISANDPDIYERYIYEYNSNRIMGVINGNFEPWENIANCKWFRGSLDNSGNYVITTSRIVSEYIPVSGGIITGSTKKYHVLIAEYDSAKNIVYMQQTYYIDDIARVLNKDTAFIRLVVYNPDAPNDPLMPSDIANSELYLKISAIKGDNIIKVASYNVGGYHYGTGYGIPAAEYDEKLIGWRRLIADINVDILGIQEYDTRMDEANTIWSNDVLWDYYYDFSTVTGSQTALKSKLDYTYAGDAQLTTGRYYTYALCGDVFLISVHFSVGSDKAAVRAQEADEIIQIAQAYDKYIIMGDFNPEPGEEDTLYGRFTAAGMNIANCGWFGKYYTWSSNRDDFDDYDHPTGTLWYIDNVIVSNNIDILNAYPMPEAYSIASSDHIPMVAELKIK